FLFAPSKRNGVEKAHCEIENESGAATTLRSERPPQYSPQFRATQKRSVADLSLCNAPNDIFV
ncbi:MAG: hypothetical protein LUD79_00960, partial [Oscillospiraceae bacterium]|nr:hypothetical protein [Oscillospiraceae bacterium]